VARRPPQEPEAQAFVTLAQDRTDALLVANDPFFLRRRDQIAGLAARHAIPAIYQGGEYVAAGGLMSYGPSLPTPLAVVDTPLM
jgi:putative tryptophan/tyrosine transport system substrate-binding protein